MNELSRTTVMALGAAPAQRGARAAAPVAASVTVRNSRRLLMVTSVSVICARRETEAHVRSGRGPCQARPVGALALVLKPVQPGRDIDGAARREQGGREELPD